MIEPADAWPLVASLDSESMPALGGLAVYFLLMAIVLCLKRSSLSNVTKLNILSLSMGGAGSLIPLLFLFQPLVEQQRDCLLHFEVAGVWGAIAGRMLEGMSIGGFFVGALFTLEAGRRIYIARGLVEEKELPNRQFAAGFSFAVTVLFGVLVAIGYYKSGSVCTY